MAISGKKPDGSSSPEPDRDPKEEPGSKPSKKMAAMLPPEHLRALTAMLANLPSGGISKILIDSRNFADMSLAQGALKGTAGDLASALAGHSPLFKSGAFKLLAGLPLERHASALDAASKHSAGSARSVKTPVGALFPPGTVPDEEYLGAISSLGIDRARISAAAKAAQYMLNERAVLTKSLTSGTLAFDRILKEIRVVQRTSAQTGIGAAGALAALIAASAPPQSDLALYGTATLAAAEAYAAAPDLKEWQEARSDSPLVETAAALSKIADAGTQSPEEAIQGIRSLVANLVGRFTGNLTLANLASICGIASFAVYLIFEIMGAIGQRGSG